MPFGLNFGKSKSESRSVSDAYGYSLGGSFSDSVQESGSTSSSAGTSRQNIAFADLYSMLYGDAGGAAGRAAGAVPFLETQASQLFNAGTGFLENIGGGAGARYLEDRLGGQDGILDAELSGLQEDVGRFFNEELLPGITDRGVATRNLGGGREGVAQGKAIDTAAREYRRGATELRRADQQARDAAAFQAASLTQAGAGAGISSLQDIYGIAETGAGAELGIYERLAGIYGGPTVLTQSDQSAQSDAFSLAQAIAQSFNVGEDFAHSEATSSSKSKNIGFQFAGA